VPEEVQVLELHHVYVGEVVVQDVRVGITAPGHVHGAFLAQAHAVAEASAIEHHHIPFGVTAGAGGAQVQVAAPPGQWSLGTDVGGEEGAAGGRILAHAGHQLGVVRGDAV